MKTDTKTPPRDDTELLGNLRQHAYYAIAVDEFLTIQPSRCGAVVPPHWVEEVDQRLRQVVLANLPRKVVQEVVHKVCPCGGGVEHDPVGSHECLVTQETVQNTIEALAS